MLFYFFFPRNAILYQTKTFLSLKFLHWLFQEKGTSDPKIDLWTRINLVQEDVSLHGPENIPFVKLYWFTFICRPKPSTLCHEMPFTIWLPPFSPVLIPSLCSLCFSSVRLLVLNMSCQLAVLPIWMSSPSPQPFVVFSHHLSFKSQLRFLLFVIITMSCYLANTQTRKYTSE